MLKDNLALLKQGALDEMSEAQAKVALVETMEGELADELKAAQDEGYQMALNDQQIPADQKIYSEQDLQNEIGPREAKISDLSAKVAELEAQVNSIPTQVSEAVAAFKAELKAKYEEQQVVENTSETGFGALLA